MLASCLFATVLVLVRTVGSYRTGTGTGYAPDCPVRTGTTSTVLLDIVQLYDTGTKCEIYWNAPVYPGHCYSFAQH